MKKYIFILTILIGTLAARADRVELINDASQITINNIGDGLTGNLIDKDFNTTVHSKTGNLDSDCYIQVELAEPLSLGADDDLVVYLQRCAHNENEGHPTIFLVEGSTDGITWDENWDDGIKSCHVYFLYRGPYTKEYSARIRTSKPFKYLRFTVIANSGRYHDSAGHRYMGLSEFQIYRLGRNDNYSATQIDRFHLITDYYKGLANHKFEHTYGIIDERNRKGGRNSTIASWCDWGRWVNGKWDKAEEIFKSTEVQLPDYTMFTSDSNESYIRPDAGQKRQPTHVTEHILYAIPGDAVALYPYYSFTLGSNYNVNFTHWYDYKAGGSLNMTDDSGKETSMLDFLIDPSPIYKHSTHGYFAGTALPPEEEPANIFTVEQYINFAKATNSKGGEKYNAKLGADLDFTGYDNVPIICANNSWYQGIFDGNGHTIRNLIMDRPNEDNVAIISKSGNDGRIRNLIIDSSCRFVGKNKVAALIAEDQYANGAKIENVQCYATVTAKNGSAAALIGSKPDSYDGNTEIKDCFVGGTISGANAAAVVVWNGKSNLQIRNTVSTATVNNTPNSEQLGHNVKATSIINCYYGSKLPSNLNDEQFVNTLGSGWTQGSVHAVPIVLESEKKTQSTSKYGKIATFFCPRSPYSDGGTLQSLPFRPGEDEFVIAGDFSQSFDSAYNITDDTIIEPVIQFRHIFRIRDGKTFADEFSGSVENNKKYVKKNMRRVAARAGVPFQIRLDSPIPMKGTTRSKYYYKISNQDYRRVCTMDLEVIDLNTNNVIQRIVIDPNNGNQTDGSGNLIVDSSGNPNKSDYFYYGETFDGEGSREVDFITYNICGGGGKYYRMLKCNNLKEGHYRVRAIGNDINGNNIRIYGGGANDFLSVMEMELTVLPKESACMVSDEELYSENSQYAYAQEENLEKTYGSPKQSLTFDEYAALETLTDKSNYLDGSNHKYRYKWPVPWDNVTYSFDYNETRNYNMYTIASHSSKTAYHAAAAEYINPDGTKGMYDRLYYKSTRLGQNPIRYGYFYYVNASADPGVMAKLRLENLCVGSMVHVSAWVAEFSDAKEKANIAFNFIAVLKNKERVQLHTFVSGYVPVSGKWMNIYYSFVPDYVYTGITPDDIDHYELELDNNCKNSESADYAIDNIRLYVSDPLIYATQNEPVCDNRVEALDVRVESPFDVMLQVVGESENNKEEGSMMNLYYTFVDKKSFDDKYAKYQEDASVDDPAKIAYEESVLRYNYSGDADGSTDQTFGKVTFNLNFSSNQEYDANNHTVSEQAFRITEEDGTRLIVFNTRPHDQSQLIPGKEYYISIYSAIEGSDILSPGWTEFDFTGQCAKATVFRVRPSSTIKIDGEVREDIDDITCCEHQSPVVQVNLYGKNDNDTVSESPIVKNARMDWYSGRFSDFEEESNGSILLSDALTYFRSEYPDAESCDVSAKGQLTTEMISYLKEVTESIPDGKSRPLLSLSLKSYVFPPTHIPEGEDFAYCYAVAIPINETEQGQLICSQPTEVRIRVQHTAPELRHGIARIAYPDHMTDVPLRIGLRQLKAVSAPETSVAGHFSLNIPLNIVRTVSEGVNEMQIVKIKPYVYLVETNDPEYLDLGTTDGSGNDTGTLMAVGEIISMSANATQNNEEWENNSFGVVFYDSFRFKESYYYRMRFLFEEKRSSYQGVDDSDICSGQDVFTVKVVPEYQRWAGSESTGANWNNDNNWERVTSAELLLEGADRKEAFADYIADGTNKTTRSYAPLSFTKVIIPSGEVFPNLIGYSADNIEDYSTYYPGIKEEYPNKYAFPGKKDGVFWVKDPSADGAEPATAEIQYDMAASQEKNNNSNLRCRPWYANTCEQIHFLTESEILGQQNLVYQKAWVDMALKPERWYTLSTPLRTVYAGDMYLPSDNGIQGTELFADITFDAIRNDRFKPAVYQRGWNKSSATVYEIKDGPQRNVAVKADWSNVYNDVTEEYGGGVGFSIKTDATKIGNVEEVLFRLPKSDTFFDYYSENGATVGNHTAVVRNVNSFKLNNIQNNDNNNKIIARSCGDNRYFLVGNPLMAHLDMKKFMALNQAKITPKYWILTEGSQKVGVFDETTDGFVGSANGFVAPMQGFFVEATENGADKYGNEMVLELNYNADMACTVPFVDSNLLKVQPYSGDVDNNVVMTISAMSGDRVLSQAFINVLPGADNAYNESNDAVLIDNSKLEIPVEVYTVANHIALSVNTTDNIDGTEIGLISNDDDETVLRFEGIGGMDNIALYDAATQTRTSLYEGMRYAVNGKAVGRLFLVADVDKADSDLQSIQVSVHNRRVRVEAGKGNSITAKVYTVDGMMIFDKTVDSPAIEFSLNQGFYILVASDGHKTVKRKIQIN